MPLIDPSRYTLTIHGMVDRPTVYTLDDLKRFPSQSRIMFLECSGNGGASSNKGSRHGRRTDIARPDQHQRLDQEYPVSTLIKRVGIQPGAKWVFAESEDAAVLTRSVPIEKMTDDEFLAYGQNGEALATRAGMPGPSDISPSGRGTST